MHIAIIYCHVVTGHWSVVRFYVVCSLHVTLFVFLVSHFMISHVIKWSTDHHHTTTTTPPPPYHTTLQPASLSKSSYISNVDVLFNNIVLSTCSVAIVFVTAVVVFCNETSVVMHACWFCYNHCLANYSDTIVIPLCTIDIIVISL